MAKFDPKKLLEAEDLEKASAEVDKRILKISDKLDEAQTMLSDLEAYMKKVGEDRDARNVHEFVADLYELKKDIEGYEF